MLRENEILADLTLAEAAAWLARLQGPERTPATEAAFQEWVREPANARAFSRATEAWEIIPGAARLKPDDLAPAMVAQRGSRPARMRLAPALMAASLLLAIGGAGLGYMTRDPVYTTRAGQQQVFTLSDGTRVALNTDSNLVVDFSKDVRRVRLDRGEAMFEVTKNPRRPFIVQAGEEQVRVLGTTFTVRHDSGKLAVVLVEGRVEVTRRAAHAAKPAPVAVLAPGERLVVRGGAQAVVDRPRIDTVTAWRRGEVMFDETSLADAAAELNRYGGEQVRVDDPRLADLRVSGVFQTHDPAEFAQAAAAIHDLQVVHDQEGLVLRR